MATDSIAHSDSALQERSPLCHVPTGWTECEAYRGFVIAIRGAWYRGFGANLETHPATNRADVRRIVDAHLDGLV